MNKNESLGAYAIMYVVKNKKTKLLGLMLKNGVVVPRDSSDMEIALTVTNLLKASKSFYEDFSALFINEEIVDSMSVNMSGSYLNAIGDAEWCKDTKNTTENPNAYKLLCENKDVKTPSKLEDYINKGLGLLQTGFQGYLQLDDNKTKRELADASEKISENEVKVGDIEETNTKTGLSTGAIVGISVLSVTVIGLIVFLLMRKKS